MEQIMAETGSVELTKMGRIQAVATAKLPSRFGDFTIESFQIANDQREYSAIVRGDLKGATDVPVRLHSQCFTGDTLGSLRCDCRDQLESALKHIGQQERGAIVYLPQEGRGIGLFNKIRAYSLQDSGLDTVQANHALGFADDLRSYELAANIIQFLGIQSIHLLTNNPKKKLGLEQAGIVITQMIPLMTTPNKHNIDYLQTKRIKSGHLL